jgi:hypothetical protein
MFKKELNTFSDGGYNYCRCKTVGFLKVCELVVCFHFYYVYLALLLLSHSEIYS